MKLRPTALTALALCASCAVAQAQTRPDCPPDMSAVTSGPFNAISCVGSPTRGLVESTLPYSTSTLFGALPSSPTPARAWTNPDRPELPPQGDYAAPNGDDSASSTFGSARDYPVLGIPNKLAADWAFLFEGPEPLPGSSMAWMGGTVFRSERGSLWFHPGYGSSPSFPIARYRDDIRGVLAAAGPLTAQTISRRYGVSLSEDPSVQARAYADWRRAMDRPHAPGSHAIIGKVTRDGSYATVVYGSDGRPASVYDSHGERRAPAEFQSSPEFTAITGHGVAWSR